MFNNITPITRNIIILNVIVYILSQLIPTLYLILPAYFPLSPNFKSWQIIAHMFMHGGLMHIFFNMFTFLSFGPILEEYLKEKRFLILYFASGLGAYFLYNLWYGYEVYSIIQPLQQLGVDVHDIIAKADIHYQGEKRFYDPLGQGVELSQNLFTAMRIPMLGASGAIFGVVAAFSTLFPDAKLIFMFIPFPIKAKYLFPIVVIASIYFGFNDQSSNVAHFAHVGGALVGFILAKIWNKNKFRYQ